MKKALFLLILAITQIVSASSLVTKTKFASHHNIELYSDNSSHITLLFRLEKGWKIYGEDPGDVGMPTIVDYDKELSRGIVSIVPNWPKPETISEKLGSSKIIYRAYHDQLTLPLTITTNDENPQLKMLVNYAICREICIPAHAEFQLKKKDHLWSLSSIKIEKPLSQAEERKTNILRILFVAFIGGFLLNLMPCVLPVLGFKLLAITEAKDRHELRRGFLMTAAGIICSFVALGGGVTLAIKQIANATGWGLYFQNPSFLIAVILAIVIFTAMMMDMIEINLPHQLATRLNKFSGGSNFIAGIFAVVLATPCSAPFFGTALSFALAQPLSSAILVFAMMGIGLATPYIIIALYPAAIAKIPRSGKWILKLRRYMAGMMVATIVWLLSLLNGTAGLWTMIAASMIIILIAFALYYRKQIIFVLLIISLLIIPLEFKQDVSLMRSRSEKIWQIFDEGAIAPLVAGGKIVVVDVTADWCLTCKVNKLLVLENERVVARLMHGDIVAMRADLTNRNPKIEEFLRKHKRYSIPFNIIFSPHYPEGVATDEILSVEKFLKVLQ